MRHEAPVERKSYDEILDLFARGASAPEIPAFRPSVETQDRVRELLERNAADELTEDEAELRASDKSNISCN